MVLFLESVMTLPRASTSAIRKSTGYSLFEESRENDGSRVMVQPQKVNIKPITANKKAIFLCMALRYKHQIVSTMISFCIRKFFLKNLIKKVITYTLIFFMKIKAVVNEHTPLSK